MLTTDPEIELYVDAHTEKEPEILVELRRATHLHALRPRMLSGNLQAQFLRMLCEMIGAKKVLELGTYTGYAAIALAMGLEPDGELHTIDINDEMEEFTDRFFEKSGLKQKIHFHIGDACQVIPTLQGPFDLVFIDADKRQYPAYFDLIIDKVRPGGLIIADDALWDGNIIDKSKHDPQTEGIRTFNDNVQLDPRVENVLLPIRHGLMLIRKK